jgi:prepilin-type N-terminal cleavage/methylation domain-containing protein
MTPNGAKHRSPQGGFTLVEVMIASGLLSFEILAVIAMFAVASKSTSYSRRLTTATSICQSLIEEAKNTDYDNLVLLETAPGVPVCFDRELNVIACDTAEAIYSRTVDTSADTPIAGMTRVTVGVSWRDDSGNPHSTSMISGVSKF